MNIIFKILDCEKMRNFQLSILFECDSDPWLTLIDRDLVIGVLGKIINI